jgi:hypothetical protein
MRRVEGPASPAGRQTGHGRSRSRSGRELHRARETSDASDQRNYWRHGWSAVLVTDTAYLRNPNYHTARDTAETLDYQAMAGVVDGVLNATLVLSSGPHPQPPHFVNGPNGGAKNQYRDCHGSGSGNIT